MALAINKRPVKADISNGFTLIELLVVIAVISVLIAVMLPALNLARRQSIRLMCQTRLKQLAQAWQLYLEAHDGRFLQCPDAETTYGGWYGTNPQLKNISRPLNSYVSIPVDCNSPSMADAYRCPADNGGQGAANSFFTTNGTSYCTNVHLVGQSQRGWLPSSELQQAINRKLSGLNVSQVGHTTRLALIGDFGWVNCWEPLIPYIGNGHGKECFHNVAFLDGHVKFIHVRKGLYITDQYSVIPFEDLYNLAKEVQKEERCGKDQYQLDP